MGDIIPISLGYVNAYLLRAGDGFILIDTGVRPALPKLENALADGAGLPGRLKLILATHGDPDHIGNCAALRERYGTRIAMHRADSSMAETGIPVKREIRNAVMRVFTALQGFSSRLFGVKGTFTPDILLEGGMDLSPYGSEAKIIHAPGHTKGSIVVLTPDRSLVCGDVFSHFGKTPGISPFIDDITAYRKSVEDLKKLDVKAVYPGHGKPFGPDALSLITVQ